MADPVDPWNWVALPSHLVIPQTIQASDRSIPGIADVTVDLVAHWNPFSQQYDVTDLRVRAPRTTHITGTLLRQIPVRSLLRTAVQEQARIYHGDGESSRPVELDQVRLRELAAQGPKPETLDAVALVYSIAEATLDAPAKRVREEFGIPPRTATHWIKLARERGNLPRPDVDDGSDEWSRPGDIGEPLLHIELEPIDVPLQVPEEEGELVEPSTANSRSDSAGSRNDPR